MSDPTPIDVRPPHLRYRDAVVAVSLAVVAVLVATGLASPEAIVAVLEHDAWATVITLLGGSAGALLFAWLDRRFGLQAGAAIRDVAKGIKPGREAALELAKGKPLLGDGTPKAREDDERDTNPIEIPRE